MYFTNLINFFQSSSSGLRALVVKKTMGTCLSGLDLLQTNSSYATNVYSILAFSSSR